MGNYDNVKNSRTRLKERLVYVAGGKCQCCGYNKCISALEFHHINPSEKDFTIGQNTNKAWDLVKKEIKKCLLVCANCHREIHANVLDISNLKPVYDEDKANTIDKQLNELKIKKAFYCKTCGEIVGHGSEYCPKCANILRRKVERPSRDELKNLIRECSFTELARRFGVSDRAIAKWCVAYQLPHRKTDINKINDIEWENI